MGLSYRGHTIIFGRRRPAKGFPDATRPAIGTTGKGVNESEQHGIDSCDHDHRRRGSLSRLPESNPGWTRSISGAWHLLRPGLADLRGFVRWETRPRHSGIAPYQLDFHCAGRRAGTDRVGLSHRLSRRPEVERCFFRLQQSNCTCLVGCRDFLLCFERCGPHRLGDGTVRGGAAAPALTVTTCACWALQSLANSQETAVLFISAIPLFGIEHHNPGTCAIVLAYIC